MKNKMVPIIIAGVLVVALVTGVVLAGVIGGGDSTSAPSLSGNGPASSEGAPETTSLPGEDTSSEAQDFLPEDVSVPIVGESTPEPEINIDNDRFDSSDFYAYLLDFSLYFHDPLAGVDDLRTISGQHWLTAAFVANYAWSADYGRGIEYPTNEVGQVLIPLTRLSEACGEMFGFPYDFAELANGSYGYMVVDGSFALPDGFDMVGAPYAELSTAKLTVQGNSISVTVDVVQADFDNPNPPLHGTFRYSFTFDESQAITPYRLVSIQKV